MQTAALYKALPLFVSRLYPAEWPSAGHFLPRLTVITPSYNQAAYIERTILSVLNQGYPNLDYIVIDGGSTDGSQDIIRRYGAYLTFWEDPHDEGQVSAINKGWRMASGDWVAFQNSDDLYAPGAFAAVASAIRHNTRADVLFGNLLMIGDDDIPYEEKRQTPFSVYAHVYLGMQYHNQSLFFRRSLLDTLGYADEQYQYSFDYELMARFGVTPSVRSVLVPHFWGAFRTHPAAKSARVSAEDGQERVRISQEYRAKLPLSLPEPWVRGWSAVRKLLYFLSRGQWPYVWYRHQLKAAERYAGTGRTQSALVSL